MRRALLAGCVAAFPLYSVAEQPATSEEEVSAFAWSNASDEAGTCGVFFNVVSQCLANTPAADSQELSRRYDQASDQAYTLALTYAQMAGMRDEAAIANVQMVRDQMWGRISNNCANIAILTAEYGESCVAVINDPEARAHHWMRHGLRRLNPGQ